MIILTIIGAIVPKESFWRWLSETNGGKETNDSRHSGEEIVLILRFVAVHYVAQRLVVIPLGLI